MSQTSVVGEGTVVNGNLEGEGSLEIYGRVLGNVTMTGEVLVGDGGAVRGQIVAAKISVSGAVQGDLRGSEAVVLERGAKVIGDIAAPRIGIGTGALVRGTVRTEGEPAPAGQLKRSVGPGLKPATFAAKPVAKAEPKAPAAPAAVVREPEPVEAVARPPAMPAQEKPPERRPPPPVLPSLGKGAKGRKKGRDE